LVWYKTDIIIISSNITCSHYGKFSLSVKEESLTYSPLFSISD